MTTPDTFTLLMKLWWWYGCWMILCQKKGLQRRGKNQMRISNEINVRDRYLVVMFHVFMMFWVQILKNQNITSNDLTEPVKYE